MHGTNGVLCFQQVSEERHQKLMCDLDRSRMRLIRISRERKRLMARRDDLWHRLQALPLPRDGQQTTPQALPLPRDGQQTSLQAMPMPRDGRTGSILGSDDDTQRERAGRAKRECKVTVTAHPFIITRYSNNEGLERLG